MTGISVEVREEADYEKMLPRLFIMCTPMTYDKYELQLAERAKQGGVYTRMWFSSAVAGSDDILDVMWQHAKVQLKEFLSRNSPSTSEDNEKS